MATKKPLRIGLIGYGFMGRTHSNAFRKVPNFFDLKYEPQLAAVCARNKDRAEALPPNGDMNLLKLIGVNSLIAMILM